MIDVKKLNQEIQKIGVDKFDYIFEESDGAITCSAPIDEAGSLFGFKDGAFAEDTWKYWNSYEISRSYADESHYNITLIGNGPIYQ
jgi:hypothetical protein